MNEPLGRGAAVVRLLPAILALALLAAHFYRAGLVPLVPTCIGAMALLFVRLPWVRYLAVGSLLLASAEWMRTLVVLVVERAAADEPWLRLAAILGGVVVFTLLAALPFGSAGLRRWYAGSETRNPGRS